MHNEALTSLCLTVMKVQALLKAVELSQRGLDTEQSSEIATCMQAAHQQLEWVYSELSRERAASSMLRIHSRGG
jgi:hypothetical protein